MEGVQGEEGVNKTAVTSAFRHFGERIGLKSWQHSQWRAGIRRFFMFKSIGLRDRAVNLRAEPVESGLRL